LCGEGEFFGQSESSLRPKDIENLLRKAADSLKGNSKRIFMAQTIEAYGYGGQSWAENNLRWNRGTIRKGSLLPILFYNPGCVNRQEGSVPPEGTD
jgi:hypothetical protein